MMRAWGKRPDTFVIDEPFYAFYLKATGKEHPGANEVIVSGETDWRNVVQSLIGPVPGDKRIFYQKQMTHHLLPTVDRQWIAAMMNCFLIRDPREVMVSYTKKKANPTLEDLGFVQQADIFDWVRARSRAMPPVIDARDVLENPPKILRLLCDAVGAEFNESMLSWPAGLRETDGIWAKHWYGEVARSTSFQAYRAKTDQVPGRLREIHERCRECYERLYQYRLH
jgi:hypothetical protein